MAKTGQNDTFYANNLRELEFSVQNEDGTAFDLTGLSVKWALSKAKTGGDYGTTAILEKATGGEGIVVTDAAQGELTVTLDPEDTTTLKGAYYHELEVFDGTDRGVVVATGVLTILKNVVNTL